jgi:transglutaminase-like putative cysteine protease
MIYDISLRIACRYSSPAIGGRHLARLMPADLPGEQRLIAAHLDIQPPPDERTDRTDFFGNLATDFAFRGALDEITLHLQARIDRLGRAMPAAASASSQTLTAEIAAVTSLAPAAPVHFLAPSPRVPQDAAVAAYAAAIARTCPTARDTVTTLGEALHRDLLYDPEATDVDTPMAEAFAARHGVCQDFSHIMICALRSLGIPAGYVSGVLRTSPPPGKPRLEGADAMHAWVRAWCGAQAGWIEYDPTNALVAGTDHIAIARGRDYSDVSPLKGVLRASGAQQGLQAVDVIPLSP